VHDALLVGGHQTLRDLDTAISRLAQRERAIEEPLPQSLPLQQLGDDVGRAIVHADVVNGDDVGMIQRGSRACLLLETPQAVPIVSQGGFQYLEGDFAPQPVVAGAVHFAHPSGAYLLEDSIVAQGLANHRNGGVRLRHVRSCPCKPANIPHPALRW